MTSALLQRFEGSFKVLEKIGNITYRLELPSHMRAHHYVFHVSQLKYRRIDEGDPSMVAPSQAPTLIVDGLELEVEEILAHKNQSHKYCVHYKDRP
jgi:hypothetical protein